MPVAIPYADVVVTDRGLRAIIHTADGELGRRAVATAEDAVRVLRPWMC